MSGGTITPPLPPQSPPPPSQPVVPQQSPQAVLIEDRIHKTRRQVKGVDIIAGLLTLTVGTVTYLFAAALADHWLVTGGLGFWWRLLLWAILIFAAGLYFVKSLWPALVLSINPVFAARTIEQCKPTLKNSLINFLLLRGRESDLAPVIYQALEQRAASDLREVHIETAVDRRPVLRLSYLLLAVVGVICLYLALSPKNVLTSAQRVLWPWTSLRAPTRVTIENIRPGNATAYHGDFVTVSADVMGLDQGEPVLLHYSTADGEMLDQVIPMIEENGAYGRQAKLPPDDRGLQQGYSYFITAGDFKTAKYTIETQIPPLITVDKVDYHYPPYTGIPDTSIKRQGDVCAIEGTQITVHATANQPIDRAEIDFSGAGVRGIRMNSEDRTAAGQFTLRMLADDPTRGEHDFYQLLFTDKNHRKNPRPIRYNIEVLRDLPPEVQIVEPQKDETNVTLDGRLEIRLRAEDPDFGLRRLIIRAESNKQELKIPPLLDARPPEKPVSGQFQAKYEFEPKKFNLKPGARVAYWAEAEDNKEPLPNVTATGKQWIVVVPPENPQTKSDQQPRRAQRPGEKSSNDASQEQNTGQQPNEKSQPDQSQGEQKQQQKSEQSKSGEKDKEQSKSGEKGKEQDKSGEKNEQGKKGDGNEKGEKSDESKNGEKGDNSEKGGNGEKGEKSNEGMNGEKGDKSSGSGKSGDRDQSKQDSQGDKSQASPERSQSANQGNSSQSGKAGEKSASPESGRNSQQSSGNQSGKDQQPIDPNANPGDAIQKILEHRQEEQQKEQNTQPGQQQQNNQQQSGDMKQSDGKQGDQQQSGDTKQSDGKQGDKQSSGDTKQSDSKQGEKQSSGDANKSDGKPGDKQSSGDANKSDGKQGDQQPSAEKQSGDKKPSGDTKRSGSKQGGQQPSTEKQPDAKQSEKQPASEQKPGDSDQINKQQQTPGAGQGSEQPKPSPEAQGANQPREKQPGQQGQDQNNKPEEGQSPSNSPKQSDSKGDSSGDRSGGGQQGGGQQAQKPGPGTPGSQTPADQGGSKSNEQGPGETGNRPGDQSQSRDSTGSAAKQPAPQGSNGQKQPGAGDSGSEQKQSAGSSAGQEQQKPSDGGKPDGQLGKSNSKSGSGNPGAGGQEGGQTDIGPQPESQPSAADEANLDYARKQTELALEHLEDQLAKDKPDLLQRLGWTREQAKHFIEHWQQLRQSADVKGPRGEAAKQQLDDELKSLGLRPGTTYLKHGGTKTDQLQDLRDSGRSAPPPSEWAEQFREYTRGVANHGKAAEDGDQRKGNGE